MKESLIGPTLLNMAPHNVQLVKWDKASLFQQSHRTLWQVLGSIIHMCMDETTTHFLRGTVVCGINCSVAETKWIEL